MSAIVCNQAIVWSKYLLNLYYFGTDAYSSPEKNIDNNTHEYWRSWLCLLTLAVKLRSKGIRRHWCILATSLTTLYVHNVDKTKTKPYLASNVGLEFLIHLFCSVIEVEICGNRRQTLNVRGRFLGRSSKREETTVLGSLEVCSLS